MDLTRTSKFLSMVLRHQPDKIGITLDPQGWVFVDELIARCNLHGKHLTHAKLLEIVNTNDKKRFTLSEDKTRIRAAQGHSVEVDLNLPPSMPPPVLYHGTASRLASIISLEGLKPMNRQHVHLSTDMETARRVGSRHGKPIVFNVNAQAMSADGHKFYLSENQVWLTDTVPPKYLAGLAFLPSA